MQGSTGVLIRPVKTAETVLAETLPGLGFVDALAGDFLYSKNRTPKDVELEKIAATRL